MVNVVVWCGKLNTNDDEKEAGGNGNVVMMEDDEDSLDGEKNKRDNDRDAWGEKGCDKASEGKTVQILGHVTRRETLENHTVMGMVDGRRVRR